MSNIPVEIKDAIVSFSTAVDNAESLTATMLSKSYDSLENTLTPVDRVKVDLTVAYAMNSLFWAYLKCSGVDVSETPVPDEIQRIKTQFDRLRVITNTNQAPKRDTQAAKRMIRHALWQKAQKDQITSDAANNSEVILADIKAPIIKSPVDEIKINVDNDEPMKYTSDQQDNQNTVKNTRKKQKKQSTVEYLLASLEKQMGRD
ncbi:hypothetical protein GJ496_006866 [Pomphorhynchus laevis]|nr:hypothetical protein GJ496_006866 [Pomphorhynchus laevis]